MQRLGEEGLIPAIGVAGFKNAGKTTLIVDLLRELTARGFRVGTVKHAHHDFDIDQPGKDSYLHRAAGATEVIVASARRIAQIRELREDEAEPDLPELIRRLGPVDLVLVEGWKRGPHRKLEVRRAAIEAPLLAAVDESVLAVVADTPQPEVSVPWLNRSDVPAIADFLLAACGLPRRASVRAGASRT